MNHIQVCCRIRDNDIEPPCLTIIQSVENDNKRQINEVNYGSTSFQMDHVYNGQSSQDQIFDEIVRPLVSDSFSGFNCSLFSYGQTGSGMQKSLTTLFVRLIA
jgi:hypothetical protein